MPAKRRLWLASQLFAYLAYFAVFAFELCRYLRVGHRDDLGVALMLLGGAVYALVHGRVAVLELSGRAP
jgi:hypothetical protein